METQCINKLKIRPVAQNELNILVDMVHELAYFEKLDPVDKSILLDNFVTYGFGEKPLFKAEFALLDDQVAGYIIYTFHFSASQGRSVLMLEDLYVRDAFRRKNIAKALFERLKSIAHDKDCCRVEWGVLKWNESAQQFYKSIGAEILDTSLRGILRTR